MYKKGQVSLNSGLRIIQAFHTMSLHHIQGLPIRVKNHQ